MSVPPLTQGKPPSSRFGARGLRNKPEPSLGQISTKFHKPGLSQCPNSTEIPELHQMGRRGERNKDTETESLPTMGFLCWAIVRK